MTTPAQVCIRKAVRDHVLAADSPLKGCEIALALKIPYKPVIDALNALHDLGVIARVGKKTTARWAAPPPAGPSDCVLFLNQWLIRSAAK